MSLPADPELLFASIYDELKRLAHAQLAGRAPRTLCTTALVHEAYIKLIRGDAGVQDRTHFVSLVVRAMRQILSDAARRKMADKRGGDVAMVTLNTGQGDSPVIEGVDVLALEQAIDRLRGMHERLANVVEMHFYDELSNSAGVRRVARILPHPSSFGARAMSLAIQSIAVRFSKYIVAIAVLVVIAACGKTPSAGSADMTAAPPKADAAMVAEAVASAASVSAATNPLCEKATYAEVSAVTGANFDKIDVIEGPDMDYLDCVFLDSKNLFAGLVIRFVSTEKLVATSSKWQTASAYFEEWSRGGDSVAGIGENAAWTSLPAGLMVLNGDQVLQFSASKSDTSDPAVRVKFEALARMVIARLP